MKNKINLKTIKFLIKKNTGINFNSQSHEISSLIAFLIFNKFLSSLMLLTLIIPGKELFK